MKSFTVAATVTTIVTLLNPAVTGVYVLPVPDTPYRVKLTSQELVDHDRVDPFNSSHPRRLMITRHTPVPADECTKMCRVPYMSPGMAAHLDRNLGPFMNQYGWKDGIWAELVMDVCCEDQGRDYNFPIVLWGPGLNQTRLMNSITAQHVAGMGFEVITTDHPYDSSLVEFPDGTSIEGGRITYMWNESDPDTPLMAFAVEVRAKDASFILDTINIGCNDKVAAVGYSLGGATAAAILLTDNRVATGVNLDGTMYGTTYGATRGLGVDRPYLMFASTTHTFTIDKTWGEFWNSTVTQHPSTWIKVIMMENTTHGTFTDVSAIGAATGLWEEDTLRHELFGEIRGERALKILQEYLSDFLAFGLGYVGEGLLAGPSAEYPDVTFVRESG